MHEYDPAAASSPAVDPLTDAYRLLRRVSPPDGPVSGWLARRADGRTVLIATAEGCADWPGQQSEDSHVLGVRDLVRTGAGTAVELEWCPERLDRHLARREEEATPVTIGEAVTIVVSMHRGLTELGERRVRRDAAWPTGHWWLTDSARPVFVRSAAGPPAPEGVRELAERIIMMCGHEPLRAAIEFGLARLDTPALSRADAEARVFAVAAPAPVRMGSRTSAPSPPLNGAMRDTEASPVETRRRTLTALWERHVDSTLAAMISDAAHSVRRRLRGRRPKPWVLAVAAAGAVVMIGVLWPAGGVSSAQTEPASPAPAGTEAAPTSSHEVAAAGERADLASTAMQLLDARRTCSDELCLAEAMEDPSRAFPPGPIDLADELRTATVLDDFGDVAVVRIDAVSGDVSQLVILAAGDDRWLLRDVHDVAQQPG